MLPQQEQQDEFEHIDLSVISKNTVGVLSQHKPSSFSVVGWCRLAVEVGGTLLALRIQLALWTNGACQKNQAFA